MKTNAGRTFLAVVAACAVAHTHAYVLSTSGVARSPGLASLAAKPRGALLSTQVLLRAPKRAALVLRMSTDDEGTTAKMMEMRRLAEEATKAVEEARLAEEKASAMRRGECVGQGGELSYGRNETCA
jgi:hypothetical protein